MRPSEAGASTVGPHVPMRAASKTAANTTGARTIAQRRPVAAPTISPTATEASIVTSAWLVVTGPRGVRYALASANASTLAPASEYAMGRLKMVEVIIVPPPTGDRRIHARDG